MRAAQATHGAARKLSFSIKLLSNCSDFFKSVILSDAPHQPRSGWQRVRDKLINALELWSDLHRFQETVSCSSLTVPAVHGASLFHVHKLGAQRGTAPG